MDTPSSNFELPQPQSSEGSYGFTPEKPSSTPELGRQPGAPTTQSPLPVVPASSSIATVQQNTIAPLTQQATVVPPAADVDLIEKVWVSKAKAIIDKTRDDPHTQSNELSKVKVEYVKQRFNKELKTDTGT